MKKSFSKVMLLLLAMVVSGSVLVIRADEKPALSNSTPKVPATANAWGKYAPNRDAAQVSGNTVNQSQFAPVQAMVTSPVDPNRQALYSAPPMLDNPPLGPLKPRQTTPRDFYVNLVDRSLQNRLYVKFTEEAAVRMKAGRLTSKTGASTAQVEKFLAQHPEIKIRREFDEQSEETLDMYQANAQRNLGEEVANLNNYYVLDISTNPLPLVLLEEAIHLDIVESAWYQPKGEPARTCTDIAPATPSYTGNQGYLGAAPLGVNAIYAGNFHPSGRGHYGSWTIDIEWDWTPGHEDFPQDVPNAYGFEVLGGGSTGIADHGDACSGIIGACADGFGTDGESYNVTPKGVSVEVRTWAQAITYAQGFLYNGESEFIEIHAYGPDPGYPCDMTCGNCGQFGYIAIEYWDDNYAAIQTAVGNGRIVYEAAGNGQMDLSAARYGGKFSYSHDSHAILVGATNPSTQVAECWSNYAFRLDANGWGEQVYTLGYGDEFNPTGNRNQMYTYSFGGTSSATPIVTAAGNDLQGISQDKYGITLSPATMRSILWSNGTPFAGSHFVGPRPDLMQMVAYIMPNVYPSTPSGWYSPLIPRNTNNTNASYAPLTALDGNYANTYLNVAGYNGGSSPAPDASNSQVYSQYYIDGDWVYWMNWTPNVGPYSAFWNGNLGPIIVRGGRHTAQWVLDPNNDFPENNEFDNGYAQQFVWSPLQRNAFHNVLVRSAPPLKNAGNPAYVNGDGFRGSGASGTYWTGFAVLPQYGNDVDAYSYADAYSSTTGFDAVQAGSARGAGQTDVILVNGNTVGAPASRLFQAIRYSDASGADYSSEVDASSSASWNPPYVLNTSLGSNEIMDMFEIYMAAGTQYYLGATGVSGGMDLTLGVYGPGSDYYGYYDYTYVSNSQGANGSEGMTVVPATSGWYVAVVMKSGSESYGLSGLYTFNFLSSPPPINTIQNLVIQPWTNSNTLRLDWNHVNTDALGVPLSGRRYVIYRSTDLNLVPLASDSIGGTTDSTFIDNAATAAKSFYVVKVKSN
jgi:hypothetical protein